MSAGQTGLGARGDRRGWRGRLLWFALLAAVAVAVPHGALARGAAGGAPDTPVQMPAVEGSTLAGEHVSLPQALSVGGTARSAVLIVGFSRTARDAARDWGRRLGQDFSSSPDVLYFEMPVLAGVPRLLRGAVLHAISSEVSDRGKHHFLPITTDEGQWRRLAGVEDTNAAYLLVVNSSGVVVWHGAAPPLSAESYAMLLRHLPSAPR